MSAWECFRVSVVLGPIAALVVLGFLLAARSGVPRLAGGRALRLLAENVSQAVLVVVGCLVGLAVIHSMVGLRVAAAW